MPYYLVENFAAGLDLRRSKEVAPPGTVRILRNAFINEGGEIEKRKAFVKCDTLTTYAQSYRGLVTGPFEVPGYPDAVYFRHRSTTLPSSGWTAGSGTEARYCTIGEGYQQMKFWAMRSSTGLTNFGALFHGASRSEYSNHSYVAEQFVETTNRNLSSQHFYIDFTNDEPTAQNLVSANANRAFQMNLLSKGYVVNGDYLYASAVGDPSNMAGTGSGSLVLSTNGQSIGSAIALAEYFGQLAIFGTRGVMFYTVDPDFAKNQYQRRVETSLLASRSVVGYADGDVVYLTRTGIRSLQARDSSNLARVSDVGSPIDGLIREELDYNNADAETLFSTLGDTVSVADFYRFATSGIHTDSGQLWMCLKDKVYVLSRHPGARVQAWATYDLPTPTTFSESAGEIKSRWVADMARIGETLVLRNFADEVFLYGGNTGSTYDTSEVIVELPFMDMGTPGDNKYFTGIDLVCEGDWRIQAATATVDNDTPTPWFDVAEVTGRTRFQQRIPMNCQGQHIALRLTCSSARAAKLGQVCIFYKQGGQK